MSPIVPIRAASISLWPTLIIISGLIIEKARMGTGDLEVYLSILEIIIFYGNLLVSSLQTPLHK